MPAQPMRPACRPDANASTETPGSRSPHTSTPPEQRKLQPPASPPQSAAAPPHSDDAEDHPKTHRSLQHQPSMNHHGRTAPCTPGQDRTLTADLPLPAVNYNVAPAREGFFLRAAGQKAGVSPAAPAHHFGGARGLLTEIAILAYGRAGRYTESAGHLQDAVTDVRAAMLAFVKFAVENPGHFRLIYLKDLVDRSDSRLATASKGPGNRLGHAVLAYRGKAHSDTASFEDSADMLCGMATLHGLANLVLEEKVGHFFKGATAKTFSVSTCPASWITCNQPSRRVGPNKACF